MAQEHKKDKKDIVNNRPIYSVEINFYKEENTAHIKFRPLKKGNVRKRDVEIPESIFEQLSWENYSGKAITSYRRAEPGEYINIRRGEFAPTNLSQELENLVMEAFDKLTGPEKEYMNNKKYK